MGDAGVRAISLFIPAPEQGAGVDTSEAEPVADRVIHRHGPGLVCDEIDAVTGRIGGTQIESRRCHLVPERQDGEDRADPAGGSEQVSGRRLRSADCYAEIRAEDPSDRLDFPQIADRRGGRVRIEMANLARRNTGLGNRDLHGSARAPSPSSGPAVT